MGYAPKEAEAKQEQPEEEPILHWFGKCLEEMINEQKLIILRIADKLHTIKNLRGPEKELSNKTAEAGDFSQFLFQQNDRIATNNNLLSQIENHLQKII